MSNSMPSWLMAILSFGIVALILTYFPVVDYLFQFATIVLIPVILIGCVVTGSFGFYSLAGEHIKNLQNAVNKAVADRVAEMRKTPAN